MAVFGSFTDNLGKSIAWKFIICRSANAATEQRYETSVERSEWKKKKTSQSSIASDLNVNREITDKNVDNAIMRSRPNCAVWIGECVCVCCVTGIAGPAIACAFFFFFGEMIIMRYSVGWCVAAKWWKCEIGTQNTAKMIAITPNGNCPYGAMHQ